MKLNELAATLRDTSERYGGIKHYLEAAGALDRAISAFFKQQDLESMQALNGAVTRCVVLHKQIAAEKRGGVA